MASPWDFNLPKAGDAGLLASLQPEQQQAPQGLLQDPTLQQSLMSSQPPPTGKQLKQAGVLSSSQGNKYQSMLDDMFSQNVQRRTDETAGMREKLAKVLGQEPSGLQKMDLSAAMSYADSLVGSKQAHNYKAPTALAEKKIAADQLQKDISANENATADDQLGYLRIKAQEEAANLAAAKANSATDRSFTNNEFKLRNEWDGDPITKNTKQIYQGFSKIESAYAGNDPADYLTMIYGLMKMQDPESSVKEAEFQTGEGIGGWPAKWQAQYQKAKGDTRGPITQVQKNSIMQQAKNLLAAQKAKQAMVDSTYEDMAGRYGFNPRNVVLRDVFEKSGKAKPAGKVAGLQPGAVENGYQFVGGDPKDPSSWKAVK